MHGMPKAIESHSMVARIFWSVVCLCAATMFCVQFVQLLQKYFSYPKKVTIEIVPAAVPFPAISLCNMRNLDVMVLNTLNNIFLNASALLAWRNITKDDFVDQYMLTVTKYREMYRNPDLDIDIFQTVLTRKLIATNVDQNHVIAAGVPFDEFIVKCQYNNNNCNITRDFTQFFDSYYYNCFTFRAPGYLGEHTSVAEGLENGWSTVVMSGNGMLDQNKDMRYIPGTYERFSPMSSNDGVRVVIHPPDTEPYPHTEGFDVPSGFSVTFGVKARLNHRIGPPHGNCLDKDPFSDLHGHQYRLITCQRTCLQKIIVNECACKDISLPGAHIFPGVKFCTNDDEIPRNCGLNATADCIAGLYQVYQRLICVRNTTARVTQSATYARECGCYPPCEEISYDITYSLSKWPADSFEGVQTYNDIFSVSSYVPRLLLSSSPAKIALYTDYFSTDNLRKAMKDFSRLNVYIADSNMIKIEESADYTQSHLLSDIGGQLGLWVGISIITLAEILELMTELVRYVFNKNGPHSQGHRETEPSLGWVGACHHCRIYGQMDGVIEFAAGETDPGNLV